jgi:hypothetical protein
LLGGAQPGRDNLRRTVGVADRAALAALDVLDRATPLGARFIELLPPEAQDERGARGASLGR